MSSYALLVRAFFFNDTCMVSPSFSRSYIDRTLICCLRNRDRKFDSCSRKIIVRYKSKFPENIARFKSIPVFNIAVPFRDSVAAIQVLMDSCKQKKKRKESVTQFTRHRFGGRLHQQWEDFEQRRAFAAVGTRRRTGPRFGRRFAQKSRNVRLDFIIPAFPHSERYDHIKIM